MGCDIHLYAERRVDERWVSADEWVEEYPEDGDGHLSVPLRERFYLDRCYDLFAILADVRNGYGFAGIPTGGGFKPISAPRGLPHDVSEQIRHESEYWGGDGHSHSHLTLRELLDYDWTQVAEKTGVVNGLEFVEWSRYRRENGLGPVSYSGDVFGGSIVHVTLTVMEQRVKHLEELAKESVGAERHWYPTFETKVRAELASVVCRVEWSDPYYRRVGSFWSETIPRLLRLGAPEDVRIVFWFDN